MALVDLQVALDYLRVDPGVEDGVIEVLVEGAIQYVADYLNRQVFATEAELKEALAKNEAGTQPMVINPAVRMAILKVAADLYSNRENSAQGSLSEVPLSVRKLLAAYRRRPGL